MRTPTLSTLILKVRETTDMVGSDFVSDDEVRRFLSTSYGEMAERLHQSGIPWAEKRVDYDSTDFTETDVPLEDDFAYLIKVERQEGDRFFPLDRINPYDDSAWDQVTGKPQVYRLAANSSGAVIRVLPAPTTADTVRVTYIASPPDLSDNAVVQTADPVNVFTATGERIVVLGAAIEVLRKRDDAIAQMVNEREMLFDKFLNDLVMLYYADSRVPRSVGPLGIEESGGRRGWRDPANYWPWRGWDGW